MSQDTLNIQVTVAIPPGSTRNPTANQVSFDVDTPVVKLKSGDARHELVWKLSGTYDDGSAYPTDCLRLQASGPAGIEWYGADRDTAVNPHLNPGQRTQLQTWLNNHPPTIDADGQSATVTINRGDMTSILVQGETLKLQFQIAVIVVAVDDESHPWVLVIDDPEVDIEMDG